MTFERRDPDDPDFRGEPTASDIDAAFAQIVAGWELTAPGSAAKDDAASATDELPDDTGNRRSGAAAGLTGVRPVPETTEPDGPESHRLPPDNPMPDSRAPRNQTSDVPGPDTQARSPGSDVRGPDNGTPDTPAPDSREPDVRALDGPGPGTAEPEILEPEPAGQPFPVDEDDDHFVPPEPPPLPYPQPATLGAVLLLLLGIVLLTFPHVIGFSESYGLPLGLLSITGAIVWFVARLRQGPPTDSGWDDGAQL